MCQQALEKLLKAALARQKKSIFPIHNLPRLAVEARIFEACEQKDPGLLAELTPYCVKARYGEYKRHLSELCSHTLAMQLVARTERMFKWLQRRIGNQRS